MGSSRARNSTRRATKARSLKPTPRHKPTLSPAATKKRLEARKPARHEIGTAAVDALREIRDAGEGPSLRCRQAVEAVSTELRSIVQQLKRVESFILLCWLALDGQNAEQATEVAKLLRRDVGDLLFKQVRSLENIAARCDGGPGSDRDDDDEFEDDDERREVQP